MRGERIIIDRKYVHKFKEENVFLFNLRRTLPQLIDRDLFENGIQAAVSVTDFSFLKRYYKPDFILDDISGKNESQGEYFLLPLPAIQTLSSGVYEALSSEKKFSWEKDLLKKLYSVKIKDSGNRYELREEISEPYDNFLISSFKAWDLFITTEDRTAISDILENIPGLPRKDIFLANMYVDTGHPFFFEHPNEHVPAIMIMEAVRQFVLACGHKFGKIPLHDTQIILNSLECQFLSYVNINYPVLLKGISLELKVSRQGYWQHLKMRVELFQGSKCLAIFFVNGSCINSHLFERIRRTQMAELRQSRFIPLREEAYKVELSAPGGTRKAFGRLINVSLEGMALELKKDDSLSNEDIFYVTLSREPDLRITGCYQRIWKTEKDNSVVMGLHCKKIEESDLKKLYDLINQNCIVIENRESL